jgi:hypothetical protein
MAYAPTLSTRWSEGQLDADSGSGQHWGLRASCSFQALFRIRSSSDLECRLRTFLKFVSGRRQVLFLLGRRVRLLRVGPRRVRHAAPRAILVPCRCVSGFSRTRERAELKHSGTFGGFLVVARGRLLANSPRRAQHVRCRSSPAREFVQQPSGNSSGAHAPCGCTGRQLEGKTGRARPHGPHRGHEAVDATTQQTLFGLLSTASRPATRAGQCFELH